MERNHRRVFHGRRISSTRRSASDTKRCHRMRHPACSHRGCRYWIPKDDGREHKTRAATSSGKQLCERGRE